MGTWCQLQHMLLCSNIRGITDCLLIPTKPASLTLIACLFVYSNDQHMGQVLALAPMRPAMELVWPCTNW